LKSATQPGDTLVVSLSNHEALYLTVTVPTDASVLIRPDSRSGRKQKSRTGRDMSVEDSALGRDLGSGFHAGRDIITGTVFATGVATRVWLLAARC